MAVCTAVDLGKSKFVSDTESKRAQHFCDNVWL